MRESKSGALAMTHENATRGYINYHTGNCAEEIVEKEYGRLGYSRIARRFRNKAGEIDLVFERLGALVFVEVKKSKDFATAAARISERQISRIMRAAGGFLANMPSGMDTETRFDAALVDASGNVEIVENAFCTEW